MPCALRSENRRKCSLPTLISAQTPSSSMAHTLPRRADFGYRTEVQPGLVESRYWDLLMVCRVDADVVDEHGLRIGGGGVGRAGPVAADGDVEEQEVGV